MARRWTITRADDPTTLFVEADDGEWVKAEDVADLEREREEAERRLQRAEAGPEFFDIPALEDDDTLCGRDVLELFECAERMHGDREGGPTELKLEPYELVVSRSEYIAHANTIRADRMALGRCGQRLGDLERERDELREQLALAVADVVVVLDELDRQHDIHAQNNRPPAQWLDDLNALQRRNVEAASEALRQLLAQRAEGAE